MSDLTEAAKAEIAKAIEIVRQDKHMAFLREWREEQKASANPVPPTPDGPTPPPVKDPEVPPSKDPAPEAPVKKGGYWGELLTDD